GRAHDPAGGEGDVLGKFGAGRAAAGKRFSAAAWSASASQTKRWNTSQRTSMPAPIEDTILLSMRVLRDVHYGPHASQLGDLHLPQTKSPPVVCLLHGGFWRMPHDRAQMTPLAADLAQRGYAAWNLEYRRVGAAGGGWPGTLEDVAAGVDHL